MSEILFDHEAASWTEALPLGNGTLGAMIFGGVAHERIQLNEDSCWSGGPMDRVNDDCLPHLAEVRRLLFEGRISILSATGWPAECRRGTSRKATMLVV
jgi:alpha-L-fucosidase 2